MAGFMQIGVGFERVLSINKILRRRRGCFAGHWFSSESFRLFPLVCCWMWSELCNRSDVWYKIEENCTHLAIATHTPPHTWRVLWHTGFLGIFYVPMKHPPGLVWSSAPCHTKWVAAQTSDFIYRTCNPFEFDSNRLLQCVAGEAEYVGTEAEPDGVQVPAAELRMVGLEADEKCRRALAGLFRVEGRRRVAGQLGQFSPVHDQHVGSGLAQVRWKGCSLTRYGGEWWDLI